jgi:hypothetical protein
MGAFCLKRSARSVCAGACGRMPDRRDSDRIRHAMFEMVMARVAANACGCEDANSSHQSYCAPTT